MDRLMLTAGEIAQGVRDGEFSASEVFEEALKRAKALEPSLSALISFSEDRGRAAALRVDEAVARGEDPGLLAGVPVVLKDNICLEGTPTTCGSRMLEGWIPPYDAAVVTELEAAGAAILGKGNMDEFAMGGSTEFSAFGETSNPWDTDRVPGGSSGGCAVSVAAGYVPVSIGSDTGGSVRQPASYCGVYGMKPTYGLVSRRGVVAFASSLDQVGSFSRTVSDLARTLSVIAAPDDGDGTCSRRDRPDYLGALTAPSLRGQKIALVKELAGMEQSVSPEVRQSLENVLDLCRQEGAEIGEVSLPLSLEFGLPCYYILAPAEASSNLARFDGIRFGLSREEKTLSALYERTRGEGFGLEVKRRILTGTYVLSAGYYDAYYLTAQKVRRLIGEEFRKAFRSCDLIILPTSPAPAFRKGECTEDPVQMYLSDVFTLPVNLAGLPALSLNGGCTPGERPLPMGIQLIAPQWGECGLLSAAAVLERRLGAPQVAPVLREKGGALR